MYKTQLDEYGTEIRMIDWIYVDKKPISDDNPSLRRSGVQHAPPHCAGKSVVGGENPANLHGLFALECNEAETLPLVRGEVPAPFLRPHRGGSDSWNWVLKPEF